MVENIINTFVTPAVFSIILSLVYLFLYKEEGHRYLKLWSVAWFINALGFLANLINQLDKSLLWQGLINACLILGALFMVLGSLNFCGKKPHFILLFISALGIIWYIVGLKFNFSYLLLNVPIFILVGTATIFTGLIYLTLTEAKRTGTIITAGSFFVVGVNNLIYPLLVWIHFPKSLIYLVSMFGKLGLVIGTLILYFEKNKSDLNRTQASYKVLAEKTPDIIFRYTFHPLQQLEYINSAFTNATGYTVEEILSNPSLFMHILHPDYHYLIGQLLSGQVNFEKTLGFVVYHKNGQRVYLESYIIPQYRFDGQFIAIEGIIRDVTKRKLMEEEIRLLEEKQKKQTEIALTMAEDRFSKAFFKSPYPMAIISKDFQNIDINYSFEESTGYSHHDFVSGNVNFKKLLVKDVDYLSLIKLIKKGECVRNFQFRFLNKFGENRTGLLSAEEIVFDERESILLVINDISDLKRLEKEISRLDRLNLIGQMAAGIGHEVRNPMTTVRGFLQMLGGKQQYSELKEYFDLMISELDRANLIISDFLSLAKKTPSELQPGNLNNIINNLRPLLQADALSHDNNILIEQAEIPDINLNRKEIHQLILNLVRNGFEAMQKGGTVTIKTFIDGEEIVLAVRDDGFGIDSCVLDKLGTPFLTTKLEGTGLGLATCYSIAERHNARITFDTGPAGTAFYVRFRTISTV